MEIKLDAIDRRILQLLQADGKRKIKEIAHELQMTNTPVFERIKRLEKDGFIRGYTALIDRAKLGFMLTVFCAVNLEQHHKAYLDQFEADIRELPEVAACYHLAGMFDYLLKVYVKDMADYQFFITQKLASLANIGRVQSSFVMTEVKEESVLPID
ncbi:Lrp/AsnC family transcriptional regulator [Lewinella cohaerens]|uniref:Lrp/AsnC family transcriptional regulator n=1 Tax=Lewinella cohaerens TaxID=70995 RepID=UPI00036B6659|nr:Lrp/AsnC family transcriptional regulator [Lewinella cohaerens]